MQITVSPKRNAPAVRAAEALMQITRSLNQGIAMTNHTVAHPKAQVKAIIAARHNADFQRFLRIAMGVSV